MKLFLAVGILSIFLTTNLFGQKVKRGRAANHGTVTEYKYGFADFKSGYKPAVKVTPAKFAAWRRLIAYNKTIPELYAVALQVPEDRIILDVREPKKMGKQYCYELNVPPHQVDLMYTIMRQNLEYRFPDYVASVQHLDGLSHVKIEDKDWGLDIPAEKKQKRDNTY